MPKTIDDIVFALDPFAIVNGCSSHREVEKLLAAARNIYRYRLAPFSGFLQQRHAYCKRAIIGKARKLDLFLLLPQLLQQCFMLVHGGDSNLSFEDYSLFIITL